MLVDASPLIYLAKIDALDVFERSGHRPLVTPEVERETGRPGLAYQHPDALVIAEALRTGLLTRTQLTASEDEIAQRLLGEAGGLTLGEAEVLSAAVNRALPALLFERRATRLARSIGIEAWTPIELLLAGTGDAVLLGNRIRKFAALTQMRFEDVEALMDLIEDRANDR